LHLAAFHGFTEVVEKLAERGADLAERNAGGQTAAEVAAGRGHAATADALKALQSQPKAASFTSLDALYAANRDKEKDYVETWVATPLPAGEILTISDGINPVQQGRMPRDGYQVRSITMYGTVKSAWMEPEEFAKHASVQSTDPDSVEALKRHLPEGTKVEPIKRARRS
jgi:hypothetical protein